MLANRAVLSLFAVVSAGALGFGGAGAQPEASKPAVAEPAKGPESAAKEAWVPGVPVGTKLPKEVSTIHIRGGESMLSINYKYRPAVVVFYRGSWCPYCVENLKLWSANLDALMQSGADIVCISYENIKTMLETQKKYNLRMALVTDYEAQAAKAFNLNYTLDAETQANYLNAGINLPERSSRNNWDLHAAGTFIVDTDGTVIWAKADKDYTKRATPKEVIDFLRARKAAREKAEAEAEAAKKGAAPASPVPANPAPASPAAPKK